MDFLTQLQNKMPIQEGIEGYRLILREIYRAGHISLQDLCYQTLLPIPVLSKIVNYLTEKDVLDRIPEGIIYTENGMHFIERELRFYGFGVSDCDECDSLPLWISPRWEPLLDELEPIFASRPTVDTQLDQAFADAETSLQRALLFYRNGGLEGKKVAFLGDDDYTSIAVSQLYKGIFPEEPHLIPTQVTVFDIDQRLLDQIKQKVEWNPPEFVTQLWDYREPVLPSFEGHFDTIVVDPPYSFAALQLVLARAISLLRNLPGGDIYLSFAHRPAQEMLRMQGLFTRLGLAVTEIYPRFNYYEGAQILGNITQMYRLTSTEATLSAELPVAATEVWAQAIYTGEISPTSRTYYCGNCKHGATIGPAHDIQTIEQLKQAGCPHCGAAGPFYLDSKQKDDPEAPDDQEKPEQ